MNGTRKTGGKAPSDAIYQELVDGLKTGALNWTHFIAQHGTSKDLLYDAIWRFFHDMEPEARALNEAQARTAEAKLQLKSLHQKIKEADKAIKEKSREIARLDQKHRAVNKKAGTLEAKVVEKSEILERLRQLEKSGFGKDTLHALHTTITDIGNKRGLEPGEAVDAFFSDLEDYDAKIGFEQELQRLTAATEAARLEAKKCSAEARSCKKTHAHLQRAINAMQSLQKGGVEPKQVISWNTVLSGIGGVGDLEKYLKRYGSARKVIAALYEEQQQSEARVAEARAAVRTLTGQQAELEASIRAIRESAVQEIERVSAGGVQQVAGVTQTACDSIERAGKTASTELQEAHTLIDEVAAHAIISIDRMGETALCQLREALSVVDQVTAKALEVSEMVEQTAAKLAKSKKLKEDTERLVRGIERAR